MKTAYVVIALVVVAAGGYWLYSQGSGATKEANTSPEEAQNIQNGEVQNAMVAQPNTNDSERFNGSFSQLMARSGSWQCDVSVNQNGVVSSGTTYVSGGKMRADFSSTIPQVGKVETHMIMRDETAYTWTSMMNKGFKFPMTKGTVSAKTDAQTAATLNQNYDYDCKVWSADESKFTLPTNITF